MSAHAAHAEHATTTGLDHRKIGMWAMLGSECMFFGSLVLVNLINKNNLKGLDPAHFGHGILDLVLTSSTTFVLLTSSLAMVLALAAFRNGNKPWGRFWLAVVMLFGLIFLGGQVYEFSSFVHDGLTPSTNLFGASFFMLVGFHGAHVALGVLWLGATFVYSFRNYFDRRHTWGIEMAGLYWHFVDLVWVAIFTLIYLI
ncbi:MAG: heme-copper oxidase subunit III [Actinobacteria bacterium]|nr:heme-copper oxidase subunit III [Actinomycetota bacterium]